MFSVQLSSSCTLVLIPVVVSSLPHHIPIDRMSICNMNECFSQVNNATSVYLLMFAEFAAFSAGSCTNWSEETENLVLAMRLELSFFLVAIRFELLFS